MQNKGSLLAETADICQRRRRSKVFLLSSSDGTSNANYLSNFRERLKTYKPTWWVAKPAGLSPWLCSRYGWVCVEKNLLQCVDCKSYMSSHLPPITHIDLYHKCCERFRGSLVDAHSKTCVWRSAPIPIADCSPNVSDRSLAIDEFVVRYSKIKEKFGDLSDVGFEATCPVDLADLVSLSRLVDEPEEHFSKYVAAFALLGWMVSTESPDSLSCDQCLRTLGLWLYRVDQHKDNSSDDCIRKPSRKRLCTERKRFVCPVNEHYSWCPWVLPVESFSSLYMTPRSSDGADFQQVNRYCACFHLLKKPEDIFTTKTSFSEHFVLAKQLLEETLSRVENNME